MSIDFNDARDSTIIPAGTTAKVRLVILTGGYNDPAKGWTGGYVTQAQTGSQYLNCEYTVVNGAYAGRKIFSLIGLHSPKGPRWEETGRLLIRRILNSARGFSDKDNSAEAQAARRIESFSDLDGLEFVARIDIGTDQNGQPKNDIRVAITPDHDAYASVKARTETALLQ